MLDSHRFVLFLVAAMVLACTPGPGIFYVLARSVAGGRREGILSALGTFVGGLVHVTAAAAGLSAVLAASALAFGIVKYAGAAYLVWLGIKMILSRASKPEGDGLTSRSSRGAFPQGIVTEVLNPKTALFFLSFIPQFVTPGRGHVVVQFLLLGALSVVLNTTADVLVAVFAGPLAERLKTSARLQSRQRAASGVAMVGLGVYVAFADER